MKKYFQALSTLLLISDYKLLNMYPLTAAPEKEYYSLMFSTYFTIHAKKVRENISQINLVIL